MSEILLQNEPSLPDETRSVEDIFHNITEDGRVTGTDLEDFEELEQEYKILKGNLIDSTSQELIGALEKMIYDGFTVFNENDYKVLKSICRMSGINSGVLPSYDRLNFNQNHISTKTIANLSRYLGGVNLPFSIKTGGDGFLNVFSSGGKHIFDIKGENIVFYSNDIILPWVDTDAPHDNNNAEYISDIFEDENITHVLFPRYTPLGEVEMKEAQSYNNTQFSGIEKEVLLKILGIPLNNFTEEAMTYITDYQSYAGIDIDGKIGPDTLANIVESYIAKNEEPFIELGSYDYKIDCNNGKFICEKTELSLWRKLKLGFDESGVDYKLKAGGEKLSRKIYGGDMEKLGEFGYAGFQKLSGDEEHQLHWKKIDAGEDSDRNAYSLLYVNGEGFEELDLTVGKEISETYVKSTIYTIDRDDGSGRDSVGFGAGWGNGEKRLDLSLDYNDFSGNNENEA